MPTLRDLIPFVLLLGVCTGVAFGQTQPEGYLTEEESQRNAIYPTAILDMIGERLTSPATPAAVPGLVQSPLTGSGERASSFAAALAEDAGYRMGQTIESMASIGVEPQRIIDGDWALVQNSRLTPFKAVCHIKCTWFDGSTSHGTAFFVSPRVLITNAHNAWLGRKPSHYPSQIVVSPGRQGNLRPFGSATVTNYWVPWEWSNGHEGEKAYDIAWLILDDRTLYKRVGYHFGYRATTDAQLKSWNLNVSGYANPQFFKFRQHKDHETRDQVVLASWFRHFLDTQPGSSGSPVYAILDGKRFAVGVHAAAGPEKYNLATRMTKQYESETNYLTELYR